MKLIINPEYNRYSDWIKKIPSFFSIQGETIYKARNELKAFDADFGRIVVKSFQTPHIINRIAYSFLRTSKAERSYTYSLEIQKRGFDTPNPIAYIEIFKMGLLSESYFISAYSDYTLMRTFHIDKTLTEEDVEILKAFARYTAQLHDKGIYHPDYSNGNILYKKKGKNISFILVDVNRMQFKKVTEKMAYKTFHRLDFSIEMLKIVAKEYALCRQLDVEKSIVEMRRLNLKTMRKYRH
jgi:tRNA A-37 threonylcarbamoyl transferase component Bud32